LSALLSSRMAGVPNVEDAVLPQDFLSDALGLPTDTLQDFGITVARPLAHLAPWYTLTDPPLYKGRYSRRA